MKTIKILAIILLPLFTGIFSACHKNDPDTEKPVINLSGPEKNEVLYIGSEVHFEVDFSDNVELKSYKVDIHNNFDGHAHKSASEETTPWSFQQSWNFDPGQKNAHIHHHEITVPKEIDGKEVATGDYHFMVYCTDVNGNETWTAIDVKIQKSTDSIAPSFSSIKAPATNKSFSNGETIEISGTVTDNDHLKGLFVAIMPEGATNSQANPNDCFAVMLHEHEAVHEKTTYDFSASIVVGQTQDNNKPPKNISWTAGNYYIIIKSPDESGNVGFSKQYPIVIN